MTQGAGSNIDGFGVNMIKKSFIFLPKIGKRSEENIWNQGIKDWNSFLSVDNINGFSKARKLFYDRYVHKARENLVNNNAEYFSKVLPSSETWRLYDHFKDEACFLDIETNGYHNYVTVVGIYDGYETKTMVKGINLDVKRLQQELLNYKLIITFNGASFDLPCLNKYYPGVIPNIPHIDLRHASAKIGLVGGLKRIEKEIGIRRADEVSEMGGEQAVYLWQMWKSTGKQKYLDLLVQYNEEDIINLKSLADHVYIGLKEKIIGRRGWDSRESPQLTSNPRNCG